MNKIKLAIVSPYPPSKNTLNEYAYHLVEQFKVKHEISEIVIITDDLPEGNDSYREFEKDKVTIRPVWKFNSLFSIKNIIRTIKEENPDVVLYNLQFLSFGEDKIPAAIGLFTPMVTRLLGFPSVTLLHNITETVDLSSAGITKNPILSSIYNMIGTGLTKALLYSNMMTVTISKYVKILEKKYGAKNVALIPHGSFEVPPVPNFEEKKSEKSVMTFGKFGTYKVVEPLIEATEIVRKRTGQNIKIVIAGTDSPNRKGYLEEVKNTYAHVDNVVYTGYVEEEDVPKIFTNSTVCAFPYTSTTGSSGVLHQAGSYGKAAIIPNIGDLKSLIEEEGYSGAFFEPGNIGSLADALETMIIDDEKRIEIAKKNYSAAASLPMSDIVDWYIIQFERAIENKRKESSPKLSLA